MKITNEGQKPLVHLLTSFTNPTGGCERRTLELYSLLHPFGNVRLWSDLPSAAGFARHPIRTIHPYRGEFPLGGAMVILGAHTGIGPWLKPAAFDRTIVVANLYPYDSLYRLLESLDAFGIHSPEIVYASSLLQEEVGLPGRVEASPINLSVFSPAANKMERPFTIGRLSRDQPFKHHRDDPALYTMLEAQGCAVRIMGGMLMMGRFEQPCRVELLPEGAVSASEFLRQLDCFFYRTAEQWQEPSGRVIFEAMACGLPVVCGKRGGYAEHIRHGENGFLVSTQEEAFDALMSLKDDQSLRERIGEAARCTVEQIYDSDYVQSLIGYYLGAPLRG